MKIINDNKPINKKNYLVATIGYFDGIHYGHKKILNTIVKDAKKNNGQSMVITFWPHPKIILEKNDNVQLLSTLKEKKIILKNIGIDILYLINFTKEFSKIKALDFITNFLEKKLKIDEISLPDPLKTTFNSETRILWMGPNNWLVVSKKLDLMKTCRLVRIMILL